MEHGEPLVEQFKLSYPSLFASKRKTSLQFEDDREMKEGYAVLPVRAPPDVGYCKSIQGIVAQRWAILTIVINWEK